MTNHVRTLPDAELVAVTWLRAHALLDPLIGDRVYTALPADPAFPLLRLFRVGGTPEVEGYLDVAEIQVDAWGDSKFGARRLAAVAQHALLELAGNAVTGANLDPGGVVTDVATTTGMQWAPDPDTGRARYLFGVALTVHPIP